MSWVFAFLVLIVMAIAIVLTIKGLVALHSARLQLLDGGRILRGPLAQLCGLMLIAAVPASVLSFGELGSALGWRPYPEALWKKLDEAERLEDTVARRHAIKDAYKELIWSWALDLALVGGSFLTLVFILVNTQGVEPSRRPVHGHPRADQVL